MTDGAASHVDLMDKIVYGRYSKCTDVEACLSDERPELKKKELLGAPSQAATSDSMIFLIFLSWLTTAGSIGL